VCDLCLFLSERSERSTFKLWAVLGRLRAASGRRLVELRRGDLSLTSCLVKMIKRGNAFTACGRAHSKKIFKRRSRLDIRKYVFANGIVDKWNVFV